jgi:hypothetical protein
MCTAALGSCLSVPTSDSIFCTFQRTVGALKDRKQARNSSEKVCYTTTNNFKGGNVRLRIHILKARLEPLVRKPAETDFAGKTQVLANPNIRSLIPAPDGADHARPNPASKCDGIPETFVLQNLS